MNGFQRWWHDVDKISTDGKNDGHLSFGESAKSFLKGLGGGLIKGIIKNPIKSLVDLAQAAKTPAGKVYIMTNPELANSYLQNNGIKIIEFEPANTSTREHFLTFTYNGKTYSENMTPNQLAIKLLNGEYKL